MPKGADESEISVFVYKCQSLCVIVSLDVKEKVYVAFLKNSRDEAQGFKSHWFSGMDMYKDF